jgi:uncharacterized protein (DUF305 family)
VRGRLAPWVAVAVLAAGCAAAKPYPSAPPSTAGQTDVWFMQHMVPHLWQATSIAYLTRDHITHPALARLADTINQHGQANIQQLQAWLSRQGLAPHGHSHQRVDTRQETDLERLARLHGAAFDLAFLKVMTARHRAGINLAMAEASHGALPEVRQLARQMLAEQQAQVRQMGRWEASWSKRPRAAAYRDAKGGTPT